MANLIFPAGDMFSYQLKIQMKPYKLDEFIISVRTFLHSIRKDKDCSDFSVYQDSENKNTYILIGEWKTREAMERHFKSREFELLVGAAKVLGNTFSMKISNVLKTGGVELAGSRWHQNK